MPSGVSIRLEGVKELERQLERLTPKIQKKMLRPALRASAKVIRDEAVRRAPRRKSPPPRGSSRYHPAGKELYRSIKVRSAGRQPGLDAAVQVKTGAHGHLLEFGTIHMGASPFLRPAYDTRRHEAVQVFREFLGQRIESEARK